MPSQHGFGDDGTKATRFYKADDGDDQMNENDEDVVHPGIVTKSQKAPDSGRFCNSPPTGLPGADAQTSPPIISRYSCSVNARQVSDVMLPFDVTERSALATDPSSGASQMAIMS